MTYSINNNNKTALITMPFSPADGASIQIAVLKSCLGSAGIETDDFYFNVEFFMAMKKAGCGHIYNSTLPSMVSEWFFSPVPFSHKKDFFNLEAYNRLEGFSNSYNIPLDKIFRIKEKIAPGFIDEIFKKTHWEQYTAVCFTLSYAQIYPSFALARKIKEKYPHIKTVFGGAFSQIHEESCPEYMKAFDFIDFFVLGDAEPLIAPLAKSIINGENPPRLPGLFYRENNEVRYSGGVSILEDVNNAPVPDYSGFFKFYKSLGYSDRMKINRYIPIEMSRGCPWGQHKPCTFCAFYPCGGYKPKSAETIENEVITQIKNYGSRSFYIVDAAVINKTIEEAFPILSRMERKLNIPFLEVRTNMKEKHVQMMKDAGVSLVQPGIEALDDGILKKMNKGVTLFSNLLFLKWCQKYGIRVSYNIILGIPDATTEDIQSQLDIIKKIPHLDPPFPMPLSVVRLSDYYKNTGKYPLKNLMPDRFYRYVHPKEIDANKVAFEYTVDFTIDTSHMVPLYQQTMKAIDEWRNKWNFSKTPFLKLKREGNGIIISDGRKDPKNPVDYRFDGVKSVICLLCQNHPGNAESIKKRLPEEYKDIQTSEIEKFLEELKENNLAIKRHGLYLLLSTDT